MTSTCAVVARAGPGELLLEALDQLAGAELQQVVPRLAALEGDAVDSPSKSTSSASPSAASRSTGSQPGEALAHPVDLTIDDVVGHLGVGAADLETVVVAEPPPAAPRPRTGRRAPRPRPRGHRPPRHRDRRRGDPGVEQGVLVPLGQRVADRLLQHRLEAEPLDHQRRRRLALAEARQPHLFRHRPGRARDRPLDVFGGDLDLDADARVGQLFDRGLHRVADRR